MTSYITEQLTDCSCKLVYTLFNDKDQFSVDAAACYERSLQQAEKSGIKVRALVLTNPHNPLGRSQKIYLKMKEMINTRRPMLLSRDSYSHLEALQQVQHSSY